MKRKMLARGLSFNHELSFMPSQRLCYLSVSPRNEGDMT